MTNRIWIILVARTVFSVLMAAAIAASFHYYFFKAIPVPTRQKIHTDIQGFYGDASFRNLQLSRETIAEVIRKSDTVSSLQKMTVEAAFLRYRLDPSPGGIFEKYIATIQQGRWSVPPLDDWRSEFDGVAGRWDYQHALHVETGSPLEQPRINSTDITLIMDFTTGTTSMIGRGLTIDVELPSAEVLSQTLEFSIIYADDSRPPVQVCNWNPKIRMHGQKCIAKLELDFSTILDWCRNPDKGVKRIFVRGANCTTWKVNSVTYH